MPGAASMESRERRRAEGVGRSRSDRADRWLYAIETVVLGLPTLGVAIPGLLALGVMVVAVVLTEFGLTALWAGLMFAGGAIGVTSWFVLSGLVLLEGRKGLQRANPAWWLGLLAGIATSGSVGWPMVIDVFAGLQEHVVFGLLASGLLLWIPSLHLILMRLRT